MSDINEREFQDLKKRVEALEKHDDDYQKAIRFGKFFYLMVVGAGAFIVLLGNIKDGLIKLIGK